MKITGRCEIAIIVVLFNVFSLFGQDIPIIKLKSELANSAGEDKAALLNKLSLLTMDYNLEEAAAYAREALQFSRRFDQKRQEAFALENLGKIKKYSSEYNEALSYFEDARIIFLELEDQESLAVNSRNMGSTYRELRRYDEAMEYYKTSLKLQKSLGNRAEVGKILNNIGNIYNEQSRYYDGLSTFHDALVIFEELQNERAMAIILTNMSLIYNELSHNEKALEYCRRALQISRKIANPRLISISLNIQGLLYADLAHYSESLSSFREALQLQKKLQYKEGVALTYIEIGRVYQKQKRYSLALEQHKKAETILNTIGDRVNLVYVYNNIGKIYLLLGDHEKSELYLTKSHAIIDANSQIDKAAIRENYLFSSELYRALEKYKEAYQYYRQYIDLKGNIFFENTGRQMLDLESKYHTAQKEAENEKLKRQITLLISIFSGIICILCFLGSLLYLKYRQKLKEQEMKGRINFFMNLAHEIKTPLTLIRSYFARYKEKQQPSDSLELIHYYLETLIGYILNFFTLEKLERGEIVYSHVHTISLTSVCKRITALTESTCVEKGLAISYKGPLKDIYTRIDPDGLNTILYNLLQNAVKYTGKGGSVKVLLEEFPHNVQLKVQDTGIGIEESDLDSIFKPFSRLFKSTGQIEGLGLGLSIVKNIVDQIGGTIEVTSKPGVGTECTVVFQKVIPEPGDVKNADIGLSRIRVRKPRKSRDIRHSNNNPTLLIVDDDGDMLYAIQDLFLEEEYNAYTAVDGKDAIEKLKTIPRPDMIISDIKMDKMNGYVFFDIIKRNSDFNTIPFVFLSASSANSEIARGLKLGAVEYIPKPFDNQNLVARVDAILRYTKKKECQIRKESIKMAEEIKGLPINEQLCLKYNITPRQKDILRLKQQGLTYKKIGNAIGIKEGAVKTQFFIIKERTGLHDVNEIVQLFFYENTV